MSYTMCCSIVFPKREGRNEIKLFRVTEIEFESSYKEITDRGSFTIPRNIKEFNRFKVSEIFRRGDPVKISFGYFNHVNIEFEGYITEVSANIPVVIKFEDEMFKVKRLPVNYSAKNVKLDELLKTICPGYEIDALEGVALGTVRLAKTQVGAVLDKIQSDWGLYTYVKGKKIICGKYSGIETETANFHLERNCVSTSLNYRKKEDIHIRIKAISTLSNGKKIEVDNIGDKDGNERQLTFYNITVKAELERLAKLDYEKYKVDRFDGSFTAFGIPTVRHGMRVKLKSTLYEDRSGTYYVEKVVKRFSRDGIRQEITLGEKIA